MSTTNSSSAPPSAPAALPPSGAGPNEAPAAPAPTAAPDDKGAVGAGRGLIYITAAKIWFMIGGAALNFVLPFLLPKAATGDWLFVLSVVSPVNNVMVTATIQAVSKFASRGSLYVEGAKRAALRLQIVLGVGTALAFLGAAPLVARAVHDPGRTPALALSSGVVLAYAFYAVFVGAANGARQFHKQAGLDATFTLLRALGVCGAAVLFGTVFAAVGGFVGAAATILGLSVIVVGIRPLPAGGERTSVGEMARFMAPVALYLLILNLLMFVDGWVLKRLVTEAAQAAGALDPAKVGSEAVAEFGVAQQIARLPYQAILSVTFVVFPLVSRAVFDADVSRTRSYIDKSIRLSALIVLALASAVAGRPESLLNFLPRAYLPAAPALTALAFGYVSFSLMSIAGTILNGAGRTRATTVIGLVTLAIDGIACWAAVRWALATGRDPRAWAGVATTASMTVGLVMSLVYLQRHFGASLRAVTIARSLLAVAAAVAVGRFVPLGGKVGSLVAAAAAGVAFVAVLVVTREITAREVRSLLRRGG